MIRKVALGLVLGVAFFALALRGVPFADLRAAFAHMEWIYLIHLTAAFVVQYALRAWRQLVLVQVLAPATTFRRQLGIVMIGFLCVNLFPARLGEPVRPFLLYEKDGVPLGAGFGVLFVDRLLDVVALFVALLCIVFFADVPERDLEIFGRNVSLIELGRGAALSILPPILIVLATLALFGRQALAFGARMADAIRSRVAASWVDSLLSIGLRFAESFVEGVAPLRSFSRLALVSTQTVLLFLANGLAMLYLARAFGLDPPIGFAEGMGVLIVTMIGIALPAPPGFAGVFEAAARGGLAFFGVSGPAVAGRALAYALVFHWWPFLLLCVTATWFLWRDGVGLGRLFRFARGSASTSG